MLSAKQCGIYRNLEALYLDTIEKNPASWLAYNNLGQLYIKQGEPQAALPLIEHAGLSRRDAQYLASVKLALTGLAPHAGALYPSDLSGGMIKRAALARALALDPDILFLDEPTAGLDPIGAAAFDQLLVTLRNAFNLTVFLVTHDLDTLYTACDRVAVLSQKKVLVVDTLEVVEKNEDAWIQEYFHGPRGRAAAMTQQVLREEMLPQS